jgi:AraC family transcriptional regulator of adaptative response / DNA-3-methyladenine glycosylase II
MGEVTAVVTTGIYCCLQGCSGRPKEHNRRRYPSAAAAEAAGFRSCHVCRPYRQQPGVWLDAPELVCRSLQLVLDGALDGDGTEEALAGRVGASPRHLRRLFVAHVGVTPAQLARSARAHFARRLIDDTDLPFSTIASLAAFGSVRQFNAVMQATFRASPGELRARRRRSDRLVADGGLRVRLPFGAPLAHEAMLAYLASVAVPGVEAVQEGWYRRTISVAGDAGVVEIGPGGPGHLEARFHLPHWETLLHLVQRARRVFSLDLDLAAAEERLGPQPQARPGLEGVDGLEGLRPPGTWDGFEVAVAAIVAADGPGCPRDVMGRIVAARGVPAPGLDAWSLTHLFPTAASLAGDLLTGVGISAEAAERIRRLATGIRSGAIRLDRSVGQAELADQLAPLGGPTDELAAELAFRLGETHVVVGGGTGRATPRREPAVRTTRRVLAGRPPWQPTAARPVGLAGA